MKRKERSWSGQSPVIMNAALMCGGKVPRISRKGALAGVLVVVLGIDASSNTPVCWLFPHLCSPCGLEDSISRPLFRATVVFPRLIECIMPLMTQLDILITPRVESRGGLFRSRAKYK